ncbi:MAG TPA: glycosyltransferase family A protein, partial [Acidimicrobiales bacterium]|nr:glycosyltransferase family A protein [Acidimicrobiales bacterium]
MPSPVAAVVIPAHNEGAHLASLLTSLQGSADDAPLRVIVVCNGCTDATEAVARSFDGVTVVVDEAPAKHAALNAGDDAAGDLFPRLYVDADVRVDRRSIDELLDALATDTPKAVGPRTRYDLSGSPWLVRAFLRTNERLPFAESWHATHLQGRGVYGTNRAGRARFERFPAIRSDDGFFDLRFDDAERAVVPSAVAELTGPTSVRALLRRQTRVVEGYRELLAWMAAHDPGRPARFAGARGKGWWDA